MTRVSQADRKAWMYGSTKDHQRVSRAVSGGEHQCDTCDETAVAIGHKGDGTPVVVSCRVCFLASIERDRATRPSRAELMASVEAAIR